MPSVGLIIKRCSSAVPSLTVKQSEGAESAKYILQTNKQARPLSRREWVSGAYSGNIIIAEDVGGFLEWTFS